MTSKLNILTGSVAAVAIFLGGCFCGAGPAQSEASLYVTDGASGQEIRDVTFTVDGSPESGYCQEKSATDPTLCVSERLTMGRGVHQVAIAAPGYVTQTVQVDTSGSDSVHLAVEMQAASK